MQEGPRYTGLFGRDDRTPDSFWISLRYFNVYRMAVATLFLGITLFFDDSLNLGSHRLNVFRLVSVAYLMAGVVFHSLVRNLRDLFNLQLSMHLAIDIVAITLLMYASGGIRSGLGVMLLPAAEHAQMTGHEHGSSMDGGEHADAMPPEDNAHEQPHEHSQHEHAH